MHYLFNIGIYLNEVHYANTLGKKWKYNTYVPRCNNLITFQINLFCIKWLITFNVLSFTLSSFFIEC